MKAKLIITAIILGAGAFLLLSDSFEELVNPYASAAVNDIENFKNNPEVQDKAKQITEVIYEKFINIKTSINSFF